MRLWGLPILLLPMAAGAQEGHWRVDLTGSRIEFDTASAVSAPSVSGLAEVQTPSFLGRFTGGVTGFEGGAWSLQGRADLSGLTAPLGAASPLRLEVSGSAGGARHSSRFGSFVARADVRLHLAGASAGLWTGLSGTTAHNSFDTAFVSGTAPSVGAWGRAGSLRVSASYQHLDLQGESFPEAVVSASHSSSHVDLAVYAGFRRAPEMSRLAEDEWVGGSLEAWVQPRMAVVLSVGSYPQELLQGLPGGRFVSLGFRIADRRKRPVPTRTLTTPVVFSEREARDGSVGFSVDGAATVEIAGDWNAWTPTPMTRSPSGRWILEADLEPGVYRFSLRVNGTQWVVPEEVPSMEDGFGGRVGLLIVS